jgi:hypothetical protein
MPRRTALTGAEQKVLGVLTASWPKMDFDVVVQSTDSCRAGLLRSIAPLPKPVAISGVVEDCPRDSAYPPLAELATQALADARQAKPDRWSNVSISIPPSIRTLPETRQVVRDWMLMLSDLSVSPEASIHVSGAKRKEWVEICLRLTEPEPEPQPASSADPFAASISERTAQELFELGGEFQVSSSYPTTTVWVKLPVAA